MNMMLTVLRAQMQSAHNAVRDEARMKLAVCVMLLLDIGAALWSIPQLRVSVQQWQVQGVVDQDLLQLCLFSFLGIAFLTGVGSVQRMLDSDEAVILFTLALSPAVRFRTLYCSILLGNMWNWMLLEAIVGSYVLFPLLSWQALVWVALLELGAMFAVLVAIIAVLCIIRYLLADKRWTIWPWSGMIVCIVAIEASLILLASRTRESLIAIYRMQPELYIVFFGVILLLVLGPFAGLFGSLYVQAFLVIQRWDRSRRVFTIPGIHVIVNALARRRTLMSALFTKMILSQSRNPFAWLRVGVTVLVLALFTPLHTLALHIGWSNTLFVAVYAAALGVIPVVEQAPCAIGGEVNRLTLYLTAPLDMGRFLRARLLQFLSLSVSIGLIASFFATWQLHLSSAQVVGVIGAMILLVIGILVVLVWGSVWDEDINLAVEGTLQTLMQEEGPMTPRRMALFNLGLATFVGMVVVLWKVPMMGALPVLMVVDVGLVVVMWRLRLPSFHLLLNSPGGKQPLLH